MRGKSFDRWAYRPQNAPSAPLPPWSGPARRTTVVPGNPEARAAFPEGSDEISRHPKSETAPASGLLLSFPEPRRTVAMTKTQKAGLIAGVTL